MFEARKNPSRFVASLLIAAVVIAAVIFGLLYLSQEEFITSRYGYGQRVSQQRKLLSSLGSTLQHNISSGRAYLLTGDIQFKNEYQETFEKIDFLLLELGKSINDPVWHNHLAKIKKYTEGRNKALEDFFIKEGSRAKTAKEIFKAEVFPLSKNIDSAYLELTQYADVIFSKKQDSYLLAANEARATVGILAAVELIILIVVFYYVWGALKSYTLGYDLARDYRFALETSSIVSKTDADGKITYVNNKFLEISGFTKEELIGHRHNVLNSGYHPDNFFKDLYTTINSGKVWEGEIKNRAKNGGFFWVRMSVIPFMRYGKPYQFVAISNNITEAKIAEVELLSAKEAAERALREKFQFLSNVSHEIRNPMNAILGHTALIDDPCASSNEVKEHAKQIKSNGNKLLQIINDVLNLAKFESGGVTVEKMPFSLRSALCEIVDSYRPIAIQKGLYFKVSQEGVVPAVISSDSLRFKQILTHLIGNAIKYTDKGFVKVTLRFYNEEYVDERLRGFIEVEVMDSGSIISDSIRGYLFNPSKEIDSTYGGKLDGISIGLALCKKMAKVLGGDVFLKSTKLHQGSIFVLRIPASMGEDLELVGESEFKSINSCEEQKLSTTGKLSNKNILVVEDAADSEALISLYLKKEGASVDVAHNGEEAVKKTAKHHFDVILMDIEMPVMDGVEAVKKLRAGGYARPILALTANALKEESERTLHAGCNAHLTKPVTKEKLISCVLAAIELDPTRSQTV